MTCQTNYSTYNYEFISIPVISFITRGHEFHHWNLYNNEICHSVQLGHSGQLCHNKMCQQVACHQIDRICQTDFVSANKARRQMFTSIV